MSNNTYSDMVGKLVLLLEGANATGVSLTELLKDAMAENGDLKQEFAAAVFQDDDALEFLNMLVDESGGAMVVGSATNDPDLLLINAIHMLDCLEDLFENGVEDEDLVDLSSEYGLEYRRHPEDEDDIVPEHNLVTVFNTLFSDDEAQSLVNKCGKLGAIRQILSCYEY